MSFNKKTWTADGDLTEKEMNDLENRVESGFSFKRHNISQSVIQNGWDTQYQVFVIRFHDMILMGGRLNSDGNESLGKVMFNLPSEFRPTRELQIGVNGNRTITIYANGNVVGSGSAGGFHLDGITYIR